MLNQSLVLRDSNTTLQTTGPHPRQSSPASTTPDRGGAGDSPPPTSPAWPLFSRNGAALERYLSPGPPVIPSVEPQSPSLSMWWLRKSTKSLRMLPVSATELIGQRIKRERLNRDMTQRNLAEMVDVGVPHISKIEAGRERPSDELLRKIAEVLGCDADELLLAARRIPEEVMDKVAADPVGFLEHLRQWPGPNG